MREGQGSGAGLPQHCAGAGPFDGSHNVQISEETPLLPSKAVFSTPDISRLTSRNISGDLERELQRSAGGNLGWVGAVSTITNVFLGLGALSLPYAVSKAGIFSLPMLCGTALLGYFTADVLVKTSLHLRSYTYTAIGQSVYGKAGATVALAFAGIEFIGATIMTIIFLWANLYYLVEGDIDYFTIALFSSVLCTPTLWLLNAEKMGILNIIGVSSNIVFCVVTFLLAFFTQEPYHIETLTTVPSRQDLSLATGIFILCFAGHACLTGVYKNMKEPSQFPSVLRFSFLCMFFIYATIGVCGAGVYGTFTAPLLTRNFAIWPGGWIHFCVTGLIAIRCFVTVSPLLAVVSEMSESYFSESESNTSKRIKRTIAFWIFVGISYLCKENVAYVEAITGSLASIITVFVLPLLFYFMAFPRYFEKRKFHRLGLFAFMFFFTVAGLYLSAQVVVRLVKGQTE